MTTARDVGTGATVLAVDGLGVVLSGRTVLQEVTFSVGAGELTSLIGPNGAGKTTLLRAILGLQRPSVGRVTVAGRTRRRPVIGYVPQEVHLDPDLPLRARDLVALGVDGHRFGLRLPSKERRERADGMLAAVGGSSFADARVGRLSGGEQQRVLVAHALAGRPRLLLLDEPLASLDPHRAAEVVALLRRITVDQGVAILLSAHEMNPLLPVVDTIVYLAEGRAVAGTPEEVVRSDVLSDLYRHTVEVVRTNGRTLVVVGAGPAGGRNPSRPPPASVPRP